jgi:hypothetical protein
MLASVNVAIFFFLELIIAAFGFTDRVKFASVAG